MPTHSPIRVAGLPVVLALTLGWLSLASAQAWEAPRSTGVAEDSRGGAAESFDSAELFYPSDTIVACDAAGHVFGNAGTCYAAGHPRRPRRDQPGDIDRGDCPAYRYTLPDCERAGRPHQVAWWAAPSVSKKYSAWFVGGGAVIGGRGKASCEGTWGMDYQGWNPYRRVWLAWTCGRSQGGEGAYQTDGHTGPLARH